MDTSTPSVATPAGTIVFTRLDPASGSKDVFAINPDGTNLAYLAGAGMPHVSADGTRIVIDRYIKNGNPSVLTATVNVDGSDYTELHVSDPTLNLMPGPFSPDGRRIVAEGFIDYRAHASKTGIYTFLSSNGGDLLRVTRSGERLESPVAYSPDGSRILFFRSVTPFRGGDPAMNLFVVNTDGTGLERLNPPRTTTGSVIPSPSASWSPDGTHVTFAASNGSWFKPGTLKALFVVNADGSDPQRMTPWGYAQQAQWSPDGRWIAFSEAHSESVDVVGGVRIVHPDGTGLKVLTDARGAGFSYGPTWSPDGSRLLFKRYLAPGFLSDLWVMNLDGSGLTQITHSETEYRQYVWAPPPATEAA